MARGEKYLQLSYLLLSICKVQSTDEHYLVHTSGSTAELSFKTHKKLSVQSPYLQQRASINMCNVSQCQEKDCQQGFSFLAGSEHTDLVVFTTAVRSSLFRQRMHRAGPELLSPAFSVVRWGVEKSATGKIMTFFCRALTDKRRSIIPLGI